MRYKFSRLRKYVDLGMTFISALIKPVVGFLPTSSPISGKMSDLMFAPVTLSIQWILFAWDSYNLFIAKNKNLGKVSTYLLQALKFVLFSIAVPLTIAGLITGAAALGLVAPALIVTFLGIATLVDIGLLGWNIFKWATLSKDDPARKQHASNIKKYAVGAISGIALTIAAGLLLATKIAPLIITILSTTVTVSCVVYGAIHTFLGYKAKKAAEKIVKTPEYFSEKEVEKLLKDNQPRSKKTARYGVDLNYYARENRKNILEKIRKPEDKRAYILKEIYRKEMELRRSINRSKEITGKGLSKLIEKKIEKAQESKRHTKITALLGLATFIHKTQPPGTPYNLGDFNKLIADYKKELKTAHQSFFREKGDFTDLFDAVEDYIRQSGEYNSSDAKMASVLNDNSNKLSEEYMYEEEFDETVEYEHATEPLVSNNSVVNVPDKEELSEIDNEAPATEHHLHIGSGK